MAVLRAYVPEPPPREPAELPAYLERELRRLADFLSLVASGQLDEIAVEPSKQRHGMLRLVDGSGFNPGLGSGLYVYLGNSWHKILTQRTASISPVRGLLTFKGF